MSDLNKKSTEMRRAQPADRGEHPYVYLTHRAQAQLAGEVRNVSLLVAIAVNGEVIGILGICEEPRRIRRLERVPGASQGARSERRRLVISDACLGLAESAAEFFPEAAWQRCIGVVEKVWTELIPLSQVIRDQRGGPCLGARSGINWSCSSLARYDSSFLMTMCWCASIVFLTFLGCGMRSPTCIASMTVGLASIPRSQSA